MLFKGHLGEKCVMVQTIFLDSGLNQLNEKEILNLLLWMKWTKLTNSHFIIGQTKSAFKINDILNV